MVTGICGRPTHATETVHLLLKKHDPHNNGMSSSLTAEKFTPATRYDRRRSIVVLSILVDHIIDYYTARKIHSWDWTDRDWTDEKGEKGEFD